MSVATYTYGTVAGVERRIGYIVSDRAFSEDTVPKLSEVEAILDQVASQIHMALMEVGYPVDTKADVTTNAPRAVTWLEALNEQGAASQVLKAHPYGMPEGGTSPGFTGQFKDGLQQIKGAMLEGLGLTRSTDLSAHLGSGSYADSDGNVKKGIFRRGMWDYPGSRTLTE